jgi:hypothetical protein
MSNLSVQVTARAEPLWKDVVKLKFLAFIELSGSPSCPSLLCSMI